MSGVAKILLIIGGLNWGVIGIGKFLHKDLDFIALFSQFNPNLPAIIYIVIGIAAIYLVFRK